MDFNRRKAAFIELGRKISNLGKDEIESIAYRAEILNKWFSPDSVNSAFSGLGILLKENNMDAWLTGYSLDNIASKKVGTVMAGNIPFAGFHDYMCVLLCGHRLFAKLSSQDTVLMKAVHAMLVEIEPGFSERVNFVERLNGMDAVIATGSDNTSRYFEYYFSSIPHIIRKNRTSVAVLTGEESAEEITALGKDIFLYYGLGCRNVSKLYLPEGYDVEKFFPNMETYSYVLSHNKYMNNFDYNSSIFQLNQEKHLINGFLILKENENLVSPVGVLYYENYTSIKDLEVTLEKSKEKIQAVISTPGVVQNSIPFGTAQYPLPSDYADGVDTLQFLAGV